MNPIILQVALTLLSLSLSSLSQQINLVSPVNSLLESRISYYASTYDVPEELMKKIIKCESGFNPSIQSEVPDKTGPNGREDSWGLAQIHLPDHLGTTKEQATDIDYALNFLASNLKKGRGGMWTCFKKLPDIASSAY